MDSSAFRSFPCAEIPEFEAFRHQELIKEALMQESGGGEAFIERAAEALRHHLLAAGLARRTNEKSLLDRLRRVYDFNQITLALARAWSSDSEMFYLPRDTFLEQMDRTLWLKGISFVLALASLLVFLVYGRHNFPEITIWFVVIGPVLAVIGILLGLVYHWIIRRLIKLCQK